MEGLEWEIFLRGTADFPTGLAPALTLCKGGCSSVIIFTCRTVCRHWVCICFQKGSDSWYTKQAGLGNLAVGKSLINAFKF